MPEVKCNYCGWEGMSMELVALTDDLDDKDFDYCPQCESDDIEDTDYDDLDD